MWSRECDICFAASLPVSSAIPRLLVPGFDGLPHITKRLAGVPENDALKVPLYSFGETHFPKVETQFHASFKLIHEPFQVCTNVITKASHRNTNFMNF